MEGLHAHWQHWQHLLTSFSLNQRDQNENRNKTVLYHCHDLGSSLTAQVMRKCLCFGPWMQMVLKIESERYSENMKSGSNWSHLHFLPDGRPHLLLDGLPASEQALRFTQGSKFPYCNFLLAISPAVFHIIYAAIRKNFLCISSVTKREN